MSLKPKYKKYTNKDYAIDEFRYILENYILPLVQYVHVEKKSNNNHKGNNRVDKTPLILKLETTKSKKLKTHIACHKKGKADYLYFFPALSTPQFHFRIRTENPTQNLGAAETILREILCVSNYDYRSDQFPKKDFYDKDNVYRNARFNVAFEIGLCRWLGNEGIYTLIQRLRDWSQKTYEGSHMSFGFIIDSTATTIGEVDYLKFLRSNHSAVFTDGMSSYIKLDHEGKIVKYISAIHGLHNKKQKHIPLTPYEFIDFANMCYSEDGANWIGVIMQCNGDILIFKRKQLVFIKRNGKWMYLDPFIIRSTIEMQYREDSEELDKRQFANEVYLSVLDTSFAHTGGCIAIIKDQYIKEVTNKYFPKDLLETDNKSEKIDVINRLIHTGSIDDEKQYFQYLDRKLRLELLSLDGATVLDSSGKILCAGAIVKIDGGSEDGGRMAATKELAKYGLAMKISMDGAVRCFASLDSSDDLNEDTTNNLKNPFNVI